MLGFNKLLLLFIRINGVPACANKKLLTDILRKEWGFEGYVVSDEGALEFIMMEHKYTSSFLETAVGEISDVGNWYLLKVYHRNLKLNSRYPNT